ncbi:MAG TPA: D-glycerate dehydrogenase [Deltaproteobacteria bacterium]|nr:D-glycerate dehydrogenase [Deltaproteobacteria bacterium]
MDLLVTRRLPGGALERLAGICTLDVWGRDDAMPRAEIIRRIKGKDGLLCLLSDRVDAAVMDASGRLGIIANYAAGYDNIDVTAAKARGIMVTNTPGVLTDATADLAWALIFAASRRVVEAHTFLRHNDWRGWDPNQMLGHDITGATLGIVGAGRIGTAVALRSRGFSMPVLYAGRTPNTRIEAELGARRVELEELLASADIVSLHVPLTADTRHLIGRRELDLMKPTAVLINTARGPVIDEEALFEALRERRIAGAGLDVYEHEPRVHPGLKELSNVVTLPHIGSATHATRARMADMAADNILAFLRGEDPPNRVA